MSSTESVSGDPASIAGIVLGTLSILVALVLSGYGAIFLGLIGVGLGFASRKKGPPIVLSGIGLFLGVSAQMMAAVVGT
ncbi:MAG: hypothetical protein AAGI53_14980 [Planctomycetota bacterium]